MEQQPHNVLKDALKSAGMTTIDLSRELGVTPTYAYYMATGRREITPDIALSIEEILPSAKFEALSPRLGDLIERAKRLRQVFGE